MALARPPCTLPWRLPRIAEDMHCCCERLDLAWHRGHRIRPPSVGKSVTAVAGFENKNLRKLQNKRILESI